MEFFYLWMYRLEAGLPDLNYRVSQKAAGLRAPPAGISGDVGRQVKTGLRQSIPSSM